MRNCISLMVIILFTSLNLQAQTVSGTWQYKDKLRVSYYQDKDGKLCNKIVWLKADKDKNGNPILGIENPDKTLRKRPVIGITSVSGLEYKGNNTWENGYAYDPESGRTFKCKLELANPTTIKLTGYFLGIPISAKQIKVSDK